MIKNRSKRYWNYSEAGRVMKLRTGEQTAREEINEYYNPSDEFEYSQFLSYEDEAKNRSNYYINEFDLNWEPMTLEDWKEFLDEGIYNIEDYPDTLIIHLIEELLV